MNFKESRFMYALAALTVAFVISQSVFFIVKAWKRAKEIGVKKETLKNTAVSSALFTIAPAVSILATVVVLANSLGAVLPWIRLTVIGNLAYETTAAQSALESMGGSLSGSVNDPREFSTVVWAMTVGSVAPLILLPFVCKKLQHKIGSAINKSASAQKLGDSLSAAAFIGIIAAFISKAIAGTSPDGANAGFMSIAVLAVSIAAMTVLEFICGKFRLKKLSPFTMPVSMFVGMGAAILFQRFLPAEITSFVWR